MVLTRTVLEYVIYIFLYISICVFFFGLISINYNLEIIQ